MAQKASKQTPKQPKKTKPKNHHSKNSKNSSCSVLPLLGLGLLCLFAIILGVFIPIGCVSTNAFINKLFLAEVHGNNTYDIQFRVGYFGGCMSVSNITGGPSISTDTSLEKTQTSCVQNMRVIDIDDLSEEFLENMVLAVDAQEHVKTTLNVSLPLVKHLQEDVFHSAPPVMSCILFFISTIILLVAITSQSHKRRYKSALVIGALVSAFALALAFVVVVGSLQGLNVLMNGNRFKMTQPIDGGLFLERGSWLSHIQEAHLVLVTLFYTVIGIMYAQRPS